MKHDPSLPIRSRRARLLSPAAFLVLGSLFAPGCFNASSDSASNVAGTGKALLFLETVEWGRLVDVFDLDGGLVRRDVVVREGLQSDGVNYELGFNAVTQSETLTILYKETDPLFENFLDAAESGRVAVSAKGSGSPPPFVRVARNGALRLQFSELVDPASVTRETIQVKEGAQVLEVRYIVDNSAIGTDGRPKGVIIIDPTISKFDQANLGIPENGVGFPESADQVNPSIVVRIPTVVDPLFGQNIVLTSRAGNRTLGVQASDPIEYSPSLHPIVVRAFRSGNGADPFNGFMLDRERPRLVTEQEAEIARVDPVFGSTNLRTLTYRILAGGCQDIAPKEGDTFQVGNTVVLVSSVDDSSNSSAYVVTGAVVAGSLPVTTTPQAAVLTTAYTSVDTVRQLCWLKFSPEPLTLPATGLDPMATTLTVQFNEPVDPVTVQSLETMVLCSFREDEPPGTSPGPFDPNIETVGDFIDRQVGFETEPASTGSGRLKFGPIDVSPDSRTFTLSPLVGLADSHAEGPSLRLAVALRDSTSGIQDLAGNQVNFAQFVAGGTLAQLNAGYAISLFGAPPTDRYFALRFNSTDEDNDGLAEYLGQFQFEPGILRGRSLKRFSRAVDATNPYVGQKIAFSSGLMTPLTPAGAVMATIYGYHHVGLGLLSPSEFNLDIEGLNWSPFGGAVFDDSFDRYSIGLAHSKRFPDDFINTTSGYPAWPNSGLLRQNPFDNNVLGRVEGEYDEVIAFDDEYAISQVNLFTAVTGTPMYPWPEFAESFTWRDTRIRQTLVGAPQGAGVPPDIVLTANPNQERVWRANQVPSIGLPLLMIYRCYPRGAFFGSNGFQVQIMVGSSALPAFRVFSAGGLDGGGSWHFVTPEVPEAGTKPTGGYNTATGARTKSFGPELYWGQVDFVVRVSRVFSHWFSFLQDENTQTLASISPLVSEPSPEQQPFGTQVLVEFRGTAGMNFAGCGNDSTPVQNANCFDSYGDWDSEVGGGCCSSATVGSPTDWTADAASFLGLPDKPEHFQLRFTFISNTATNQEPELDALGFAWNVMLK